MSRVKVYCRVRPARASPETRDTTFATTAAEEGEPEVDECLELQAKSVSVNGTEFSYDATFPPASSQEDVYATVAENIVADVKQGYNGAILAYGQTGTGKTHTMSAVAPRALEALLPAKISYVQLYCETLLDLLTDRPLASAADAARLDVKTAAQALALLAEGDERRVVAETAMNTHSSRSHAILMIHTESRENGQCYNGTLMLVDLAGSERAHKSSRYAHMAELRAINLSLSALGNVVNALASKRSHVPYRDSKLTRLLQPSFESAKTAMILTVAPETDACNESLNTLRFGQRAMDVPPINALPNVTRDYRELYEDLQARLDAKDDRLHRAEIALASATQELADLRSRVDQAEHERDTARTDLEHDRASHEATLAALQRSAGGDVSALSEATSRLEAEAAEERKRAEERIADMRDKCARQVASYKAAAGEAGEEWNNIEYELETERKAHLDTLAELRAAKEAAQQADADHTQRIADLTADHEELQEQARRAINTIADLKRQLEDASKRSEAVLQERDDARREAAQNAMMPPEMVGVDYVSRTEVTEMQQLYTDTIDQLVARVEQLETSDKVAVLTAGVVPGSGGGGRGSALRRKFAGVPSAAAKRRQSAPGGGGGGSRLSRLAEPRSRVSKRGGGGGGNQRGGGSSNQRSHNKSSFRERFAHRRFR